MSSATSTEPQPLSCRPPGARGGDPALPPHRAGVRDGGPGLHPWQLFTLAGLIGATVVVFVSRGQAPAGIVLLSLTVFTAAILGVAAWRTLAPLSGKDDPAGPRVVGGRTRTAIEREKTLVLRSIKELEFDRAMGKVSEKDFAEVSARLRARAAGLLRQLDAGTGYREQIEKEIARRVGETTPANSVDEHAHVARTLSASRPTTLLRCASCGTDNDADARFCKNCGTRMEPTA